VTTDGLDVQAVVDQFRSSTETLDVLHGRLRSIIQAEEGADHAAAAISQASATLAATAASLDSIVIELRNAQTLTNDALVSAQQFLSATDLGALRAELASLTAQVHADMTHLGEAVAELSRRVPTVEQVRAELEALKQQIPPRTRKKMGL
jgi:multidrug resistance efflux pump